MADDINFSKNGRRPQIFKKWKTASDLKKMEYDLNFKKMEDNFNFWKMEDN